MTFSTVIQNIIKIMSKYWDVFLIKGVSVTLALAAITVFFGAIIGALPGARPCCCSCTSATLSCR